jgi:hypothetical protein
MSKHTSESPAILPPPETRADWRERIRRAKDARDATQTARRGKPAAFEAQKSVDAR